MCIGLTPFSSIYLTTFLASADDANPASCYLTRPANFSLDATPMGPTRRLGFAEMPAGYVLRCQYTAELHVLNDEYIRQYQGVKLSGWPPIAKKRKCQKSLLCVCVCVVSRCETTQRLHCHSVLRALQSNVYFQNCLCEQSDPDLDQCLQVHRKFFLHSCVRTSSS